ncbi:MAG: hypothetical protein NC918_06045 [Candidatus Omnitrophica bacterium]|nr:hypothetical protein [Candidatus Omnitrophota bacterium]
MKQNKLKLSQAMVELAILGPFLLATFGLILTYVTKLNNDQWILMSAFRHALARAHDTNKIVSYTAWDDRNQASVEEPIIGRKATSSAGATVHWSINDVTEGGDPNAGSGAYMKINGGAIPFLYEYKLNEGSGGGIEPTYISWERSAVTVNSQNGFTHTSRHAGLAEVMIYKVDKQVFVQGRGHGGSRSNSVSE